MSELSSPSNSDHGLQLEHASDQSITHFLAESITNLLTHASATELQNIEEYTAEIRRRHKQQNYWLRLTCSHMRNS
jgi:signal transduction histidine kinase